MKAVIYARVSTDEQAASGLGLADQLRRCRAYAEAGGHTVAAELTENGCSGSLPPERRPELSRGLAMLEGGEAGLLIVLKLDRLGRSVQDVAALAERARRRGWALAMLDCQVDTSTAAGDLFFNILAAFAQFERKVIAERTSAALQAKKAAGARMGRPVELSAEARRRVRELRRDGLTMRKAADQLNAEAADNPALRRPRGGRWNAAAVSRSLRSDRLDREAEANRRKAAETA